MDTDWGMIAIRLGLYLSLMVLMGLAVFPLYALRSEERADGSIISAKKALIFWSSVAILLSGLGFLVLVAGMMGTSIIAIDWQTSQSIIFETPIGTAWMVRMMALSVALLSALFIKRSVNARLAAVAFSSAVAVATLVWTGHAGASEGLAGNVHKTSDIFHMIAASIWLGGIAAFMMMLTAPANNLWGGRLVVAHRALEQFSRVGTICVAVIVLTGVINGQILVGITNLKALVETSYGQLLLFKLFLVAAMLLLAAKNRWRLTPDLGAAVAQGEAASAVAALRTSLLLEAGAAILILGLVAWFGTLEPPTSMMAV